MSMVKNERSKRYLPKIAFHSEKKNKTQYNFKLHQLVHSVTSLIQKFNILRINTVYCSDIWWKILLLETHYKCL